MPVLLMELRMTNPLKFLVLSLFIGQFFVSCSCINVVSLIFSRIILILYFFFGEGLILELIKEEGGIGMLARCIAMQITQTSAREGLEEAFPI